MKTYEVISIRVSSNSFRIIEDTLKQYDNDNTWMARGWISLSSRDNSFVIVRAFDPKNSDEMKEVEALRNAVPLIDEAYKAIAVQQK